MAYHNKGLFLSSYMLGPYWLLLSSLSLTLDLSLRPYPPSWTLPIAKIEEKQKGSCNQQLKALAWSWHTSLYSQFISNPTTGRWETQSKKCLKKGTTRNIWQIACSRAERDLGVFFDPWTIPWDQVAKRANADFSCINRKVESRTKEETTLLPLLMLLHLV